MQTSPKIWRIDVPTGEVNLIARFCKAEQVWYVDLTHTAGAKSQFMNKFASLDSLLGLKGEDADSESGFKVSPAEMPQVINRVLESREMIALLVAFEAGGFKASHSGGSPGNDCKVFQRLG